MLPIRVLESTANGVVFEPPAGKPDKNSNSGLKNRPRVMQEAYKGNTCWYYVMNFLRERIGNNPCDEHKAARDIEKLCSERRKKQTALEVSLPAICDQLGTETGVMSLVGIDHAQVKFILENRAVLQPKLETPEALEGCASLIPFMEEFSKQNIFRNMHEFLSHKKYSALNDINTGFLKSLGFDPVEMYKARATKENGFKEETWEKLSLVKKAIYLESFAIQVSTQKYGLKTCSWTPLKNIDDLIAELKAHGPMYVGGRFGTIAYENPPGKTTEMIGDRETFGWPAGSPRRGSFFSGQAILIVGAKKVNDKAFVYFMDPIDASDPNNKGSQRIFKISYENLTSNVCDAFGRVQKDSKLGYGYFGNFAYDRPST